MIPLSPWMVVAAVGLLLVGLLHGRSRRRRRFFPLWLCGLLALWALVGVWFLLGAQFGSQIVHVHLP